MNNHKKQLINSSLGFYIVSYSIVMQFSFIQEQCVVITLSRKSSIYPQKFYYLQMKSFKLSPSTLANIFSQPRSSNSKTPSPSDDTGWMQSFTLLSSSSSSSFCLSKNLRIPPGCDASPSAKSLEYSLCSKFEGTSLRFQRDKNYFGSVP